MEPEVSLHSSQQLTFCPYPLPDKLIEDNFNIILPSLPISSKRSLFPKVYNRYPAHSPVANARLMSLFQAEESR
jgi:hypothetical protein